MSMEIVTDLTGWFTSKLHDVKCSDETKAYIVSVLVEHAMKPRMLNSSSVVLQFADAKIKSSFEDYKLLGDWVLWSSSVDVRLLRSEKELSETLARLSYYACHRILRCKWKLYEELADNMPVITQQVRDRLQHT